MRQVPENYKHTSTSNVLSNISHGESPTSVHKMCEKQTGAAYTHVILTICSALVMQETRATAAPNDAAGTVRTSILEKIKQVKD